MVLFFSAFIFFFCLTNLYINSIYCTAFWEESKHDDDDDIGKYMDNKEYTVHQASDYIYLYNKKIDSETLINVLKVDLMHVT